MLASAALHAAIAAAIVAAGLLAPRAMDEAPEVPAQIDVLLGDNAPTPGEASAAATPPRETPSPPTPPPAPPTPATPPAPPSPPVPPTPEAPPAPPASPAQAPPPPPPEPPSEAAPPPPPPPVQAPAAPTPSPPPPPPPPPPTPAPAPPPKPPAPPAPPPQVNLGGGAASPAGEIVDDDNRIRPAKGDSNNLAPQYPPGAGEKGEQGTVGLRLYVDTLGLVTRVEIVRSSGYPRLDRAAQVTLRTWHFTPALKDGQPAADTVEININFKLE